MPEPGYLTSRDEKKGFVEKKPPESGSKVVGYTYNPNDAMIQNPAVQKTWQDTQTEINPNRFLDGQAGMNDDFYRRTAVRTTNDKTSTGNSIRRTQLSLARQIGTKRDQEAVIRLVARVVNSKSSTSTQKQPSLVNVIPPYTKFFLENVQEARSEKAQILETFGEFIAFFFGRRPEIYQFSGRLLNTRGDDNRAVPSHDWKNDFQEVYDNFLRGTKAVENKATVFIQYDDVMTEGFVLNCTVEYHGVTNNECPFSFSMLVTNRAPINQLQRLAERKARSIFSAAEQQLLDNLAKIQSQALPFSIMQKALSGSGLGPSDIILYTASTNKVKSSNTKTQSPTKQETLDDILAGIDTSSTKQIEQAGAAALIESLGSGVKK